MDDISTSDYFLFMLALLLAHVVLILGFAIVLIRWFRKPTVDELESKCDTK